MKSTQQNVSHRVTIARCPMLCLSFSPISYEISFHPIVFYLADAAASPHTFSRAVRITCTEHSTTDNGFIMLISLRFFSADACCSRFDTVLDRFDCNNNEPLLCIGLVGMKIKKKSIGTAIFSICLHCCSKSHCIFSLYLSVRYISRKFHLH